MVLNVIYVWKKEQVHLSKNIAELLINGGREKFRFGQSKDYKHSSQEQTASVDHVDFTDGRYFVVKKEEDKMSTNFLDVLIASSIRQANDRDEQHRITLNHVKDNSSLVTKTPWLRRTQWEKTFSGKNMEDLVKLTEAPGMRANAERTLWDSTARVVNKCIQGFLDCCERGWMLLPFWLASVDRNKENTKPFRQDIASDTIQCYIGYWQQYLQFCIRATLMEPSVQFTARQQDCIKDVIDLTQFDDDEPTLDTKVFELSVLLIQHSDYASQKSSLIYFCGVMGYNIEYKQWRQPHEYTKILAGVQFVIRMLLLESALPIGQRDDFSEDSEIDPIQAFRAIRDKRLVDGEGIILLY